MKREGILAEPIIRDPSMSKALWQITFDRADRANFCMVRAVPTCALILLPHLEVLRAQFLAWSTNSTRARHTPSR